MNDVLLYQPSVPDVLLTGKIEDIATSESIVNHELIPNGSGGIDMVGAVPQHGLDFTDSEDSDQDTTSTSFQDAVSLTQSLTEDEKYILTWYAEISTVSEVGQMQAIQSSPGFGVYGQSETPAPSGVKVIRSHWGFKIVVATGTTSYTFKIQWRSIGGSRVDIKKPRLTLWRVK